VLQSETNQVISSEPFFTHTSWTAWAVYSFGITPVILGVICIFISLQTPSLPQVAIMVTYIICVALFAFILSKFTVESYSFFNDHFEILRPLNKRNFFNHKRKCIDYKEITEAYFYKFQSAGLSNVMVIKLKERKILRLQIGNERQAMLVLKGLKERNVNVALKTKSIYNR
jgi:hypothetical protein